MSRRKLTIIVTCTERKSATPQPQLMARNLPGGGVANRARTWVQRLADSEGAEAPLADLYRGETWSQAKRLIATTSQIGFTPEVLVASAGLGLRGVDDRAPAYAATFNSGHADSVVTSSDDAPAWWRALPHTRMHVGRRAIWVLSESYSRAIAADLFERTTPDQLLVFGGSKEIPDDVRIRSDRGLRHALGGTTTSLNLRTAIRWLTLSPGGDPFCGEAGDRWRAWSEREQRPDRYDRSPVTDETVRNFARTLVAQNPGVSKTRALKLLREAGLACEQKRFSNLFQQAVPR
jgi:hypothetical protein